MNKLVQEYRRQSRWRRWDEALARLPLRPGQRVLDLGCGVGDITARLHEAGVSVTGVDVNPLLLDLARESHPSLSFVQLDLNLLTPASFGLVDGIWTSFVAAYFCDLPTTLKQWSDCLAPGGWLALIEIDDLLGHTPLKEEHRQDIKRFYESALAAKRYHFTCGRHLATAAKQVGLRVIYEGVLPDPELSFSGAAPSEIVEAWQLRLSRMVGLRNFLGEQHREVEQELLTALASSDHRSLASVIFVLAEKEG